MYGLTYSLYYPRGSNYSACTFVLVGLKPRCIQNTTSPFTHNLSAETLVSGLIYAWIFSDIVVAHPSRKPRNKPGFLIHLFALHHHYFYIYIYGGSRMNVTSFHSDAFSYGMLTLAYTEKRGMCQIKGELIFIDLSKSLKLQNEEMIILNFNVLTFYKCTRNGVGGSLTVTVA